MIHLLCAITQNHRIFHSNFMSTITREFDLAEILFRPKKIVMDSKSEKTRSKKPAKAVDNSTTAKEPVEKEKVPAKSAQISAGATDNSQNNVNDQTEIIDQEGASGSGLISTPVVLQAMSQTLLTVVAQQQKLFETMEKSKITKSRDNENSEPRDEQNGRRKRKRSEVDQDEPEDNEEEGQIHSESEPEDDQNVLDQIDNFLKANAEIGEKNDDKSDKTANADDDFLAYAKQFNDDDKVGPKIEEGLASVVTNLLQKRAPKDKLKDIFKETLRPENVELLQSPKVNREIWSKMFPNQKSRDIRLCKVTNYAMKAMILLVKLLNDINDDKSKHKPTESDISKTVFQALVCLSASNHQMSVNRRDLIKPVLKNDYAQLCSASTPVTTFLFGDDLSKNMKDISEANKMGTNVSRYSSQGSGSHGSSFKGGSKPGGKGKGQSKNWKRRQDPDDDSQFWRGNKQRRT